MGGLPSFTHVGRDRRVQISRKINALAPEAIAAEASRVGAWLVHYSTDYVFDGSGERPWREEDATGPQGVYGASKLAGEAAVLAACPNAAVLRTAWVYSPFGANFVRAMLRLAGPRNEVGVVADQFGNPTSALDIADGVLAVAANLAGSSDRALRGTFHMAGAGDCSWAEFAEAIFAESAALGGPAASVRHITTAEYPTPARRPANSRLDCARLARVHGVRLRSWREALPEVIARLLAE